MALRAGTLPGLLARLEPWIVQVVGNALERKESPAHFTHHVMGEFAFVLEVASLAGGRGLAAFFVGVRQARIPVPFAAERSAEHQSGLQSLMRISYAVFCLKN